MWTQANWRMGAFTPSAGPQLSDSQSQWPKYSTNQAASPENKLGPRAKQENWTFSEEFSYSCPLRLQYLPLLHITYFTVTATLWLCVNTPISWVTSSKVTCWFLAYITRRKQQLKGYKPSLSLSHSPLSCLTINAINLIFLLFLSILIWFHKSQE